MGNCESSHQEICQRQLEVQILYSNKSDVGLFDYESMKDSLFTRLCIAKGGFLMKTPSNTIIFQESLTPGCKPLKPVLNITYNEKQQSFVLEKLEDDITKDSFWLVVRDQNSNKGYQLEMGDYIRLGRSVFKLIEFQTTPQLRMEKERPHNRTTSYGLSESFFSPKDLFRKMSPRTHSNRTSQNSDQFVSCRICLEGLDNPGGDFENPMIAPCNCTGSVKYVHWECLSKWMTKRLQRNDDSLTLLWKKFQCELCKKRIGKITHRGRVFDFVEAAKARFSLYAILEIFSRKSMKSKGLHILNLASKSDFKLGRGKECDLKLSDISISRVHSSLIFNRSTRTLTIKDNCSKFGSLVLLRKKIPISSKSTNTLQIGGLCFRFVDKTPGFLDYCYDSQRRIKDLQLEDQDAEIRLAIGKDEDLSEENHNILMEENA